jgi:6-phosphogluconolactonase (cycloisomerase 2 family)
MNLLTRNQGSSVRRTHRALLVFVAMLCGLVGMDSLSAQTAVSRYAYVTGANGISMYTVNIKTGQLRSNGSVYPGSALGTATVDPSGKFFYVGEANAISEYTINATTGVPTPVGSPYACPTGYIPQWITVDPLDRFVYVVNNDSGFGSISAYTLDSDTGALTPVAGSPFATGFGPASMVIDPTGKFAYVNNEDDAPGGDVSGYTIDAATGALTAMAGSPFLSRSGALSIALAPSGKFGYVGAGGGAQITAFSINPTTGVPTVVKGSPFMAAGNSYAIALNTSGKLLYTLGGGISAFIVNTATGKLKLVTGSPFPAGDNPFFATVDPGDTRLYVTNIFSNEVWTYKMASSGVLTVLSKVRTSPAPGPVALVTGSTAVTYTPKFLYAANNSSNNVSAYTIKSPTGKITQISSSPFPAGSGPRSITTDPFVKFAYCANQSGVSAYTINSTSGDLTPISGSPFASGTGPDSVAVDPSGRFAYVSNSGSPPSIYAYTINASTGALTYLASYSTGTYSDPLAVAIDPTGQFLYVANSSTNGTDGNVLAFAINASTGALTAIGSPLTSYVDYPNSVAVDPSGRFAYVANSLATTVSVYNINATTGALSPISGSPSFTTGPNPASVTVNPLGTYVYVPSVTGNYVNTYAIDASTGALTQLTDSPFESDQNPLFVAIDPSGKFAYAANNGSNDITAYKVNGTSGDLISVAGDFPGVAAGTGPISAVATATVQ